MNKIFSKRSKIWMFLTLAMFIALVTAGTGTSLAYADSNQIPFNGSFSGAVTITGETTAALGGSGIAAHLGLSAYVANVSDITPTATGFTDVLVETLTAANGDTLTIRCVQVAVQTSPGVFVGTDQWTVTGGTGRFAGATGQGTGVTQVNLNSGTFTKQLIGTISAPTGN